MTLKSTRKSVSFKAQARTIDHLGKGQIADAPTAISELWKNSYDAYARDVALHLFDGDIKCGAIIDNGCGMTYEQLSDSWLTIGTASKSKKKLLPEEDRFGLADRFTQGEKGIGRLSTAFLAPVTLIVTKKMNTRYAAALIDWRLFENTYLGLHDIKVPMDEFDELEQLPEICSALQREMLLNLALNPTKDNPDEAIVRRAWERFTEDELEAFELRHNKQDGETFLSTEDKVKQLCNEFNFISDYPDSWNNLLEKVESEDVDGAKHGTALFLLDLNRDLELITNRGELDRAAPEYQAIEGDLVDTLRAFVDPFERDNNNDTNDFHYEIQAFDRDGWMLGDGKEILNYKDVFDSAEFSKLEHKIEGVIDNKGWFRGTVVAFGALFDNVVFPCRSLGMPLETKTGSFGVKLGTFELEKSKSSHTEEEVSFLTEQADKYGGLMIFRDGLRVLPYGKADNDFFEIDDRRNKNAGRYHWATRRIFGQVSLHQEVNKGLKDKAGREGFIKNRVTREFKELMVNLLLNSADKFFGTKSDNRKIMLAQVAKDKKKQKKAQRSTAKATLKTFTSALGNNEPKLNAQVEVVRKLHTELESGIKLSLNHLDELVEKINKVEALKPNLKAPNKPAKLDDSLEVQYRTYRDLFAELSELLQTCRERLNKIEAAGQYLSPIESTAKKYKNSEAALTKMVNRYAGLIEKTLENVNAYWLKESRSDRKSFEEQALHLLDSVTESTDTEKTLNSFDAIYNTLAEDISYKYEAFLQALDKLEQGIDIDSAFVIAEEERARAEQEVNQIRGLAQLGISFEVLAHELQAQDQTVTRSLNSMSSEAKKQIGFKNAMQAHKQFTEYLRFLSPLKLSGYQSRDDITGTDIVKNIEVFFRDRFERQNVELDISDAFKRMVVVDVPSRIQPVFINILNNALYWVGLVESREIKIDVIDDLVVIANSGPAIDEDDVERLFELFYSRRTSGNGVGLYLSKQNLAVARHKIWYAEKPEEKLIQDGANFVIQFRGMEVK
ncbi:ATP-binding protein [Vibrio splendidus]